MERGHRDTLLLVLKFIRFAQICAKCQKKLATSNRQIKLGAKFEHQFKSVDAANSYR